MKETTLNSKNLKALIKLLNKQAYLENVMKEIILNNEDIKILIRLFNKQVYLKNSEYKLYERLLEAIKD